MNPDGTTRSNDPHSSGSFGTAPDDRNEMSGAGAGGREALRKELLARRAALADRPKHEQALVDRVGRWLRAVPARRIAAFWPIRGEPDILPAVSRWLAEDATRCCALPLIEGERLSFLRWVPNAPMRPGRFGIPVPDTAELVVPQLLLVPCVGIDRRRYRLGYGAGYYDRTLPMIQPRPVAVGVGFDCARVDSIDPAPHDARLDLAITESGVW